MADTYFDYILSQCRTQGISDICKVATTRKALKEMANSGFNGCCNITEDRRLFETVEDCLDNHEFIDPNTLGRDALEVYNRCRAVAFSAGSINYDRFFDLLVDFNWLQASIQNAKNVQSRYIELLSDPIKIRCSLKEYLLGVYNDAVRDRDECVYINEAIQAKGKFFPGLFTFRYEESRYYVSPDFTKSDLRSELQDRMENSHKGMALFLGLTATAVLAENIRKGLCG